MFLQVIECNADRIVELLGSKFVTGVNLASFVNSAVNTALVSVHSCFLRFVNVEVLVSNKTLFTSTKNVLVSFSTTLPTDTISC